jgi:hypothetical protein
MPVNSAAINGPMSFVRTAVQVFTGTATYTPTPWHACYCNRRTALAAAGAAAGLQTHRRPKSRRAAVAAGAATRER